MGYGKKQPYSTEMTKADRDSIQPGTSLIEKYKEKGI